MMTPEPEPEPLKDEEGVEEGEEEPEVEGALLLLPASGLRRTGPVGSPEATVTAEAAARRACRRGTDAGEEEPGLLVTLEVRMVHIATWAIFVRGK